MEGIAPFFVGTGTAVAFGTLTGWLVFSFYQRFKLAAHPGVALSRPLYVQVRAL